MTQITTKDGVKLYVKDWGQGRPVVMVHGWPLSADSFDDLALAIANAGMRAISYDRRGFGRSEQPWTGYDYDTLADDLEAVLEQTGARDATLLGFSMGGGEVARFLSRHGSRKVKQAILIASILPYLLKTQSNPDGVDASQFDEKARLIAEDRASYWGDFFKDFFGVGWLSHPVSAQTIEWARSTAMQAGLWPTLACAKALSTTDFRTDLAAFRVPTLIIHGTADKTVPIAISSRKTAIGIKDAQLIEYDGAPHGLFASHKTRLIADVLQFLRLGESQPGSP